ncbi:MAG: hypothetical protein K2X95_09500 [Flavobacteriaceae bacterium]|nr:hypothetical protein [Flavobacteriaceae bacterium]
MKNQFLYLFLFFAFISCSTEVKFNNPAFEGQKDNVFWRAVDSKATLVNGVLTIEGFTRNEKLTLIIPSPTTMVSHNDKNSYVTYILGTSTTKTATYVLTATSGTITFSTGLGIGGGKIVITGYDGVNNIVSGTFKFNAENVNSNPLVRPTLNFQYGNFYIPLK